MHLPLTGDIQVTDTVQDPWPCGSALAWLQSHYHFVVPTWTGPTTVCSTLPYWAFCNSRMLLTVAITKEGQDRAFSHLTFLQIPKFPVSNFAATAVI